MYTYTHTRVYIYIYTLEVGGVSPFVKPPTGKSFRFVRACERARDQRFDCVARAVVRPVYLLLCGKTMPGGVSTKNVDFNKAL